MPIPLYVRHYLMWWWGRGVCVRELTFQEALFSFIVLHYNSIRLIFTGVIVAIPTGQAMHYVVVGLSP